MRFIPSIRTIQSTRAGRALCLFAAGSLMFGASVTAFAQQPKNLEPLPDVPPPPRLAPGTEDAKDPQVTVRQEGGNKIEEYRVNGRLYAVRVTPPIGKPYVMIDQDGKGNMIRGDDIAGQSVKPPRWVIFEF